MQNFADLGLSEAALAAVERLGYENPTPVQLQAIPLVLEGRDLIAAASTGTGQRILHRRFLDKKDPPEVILPAGHFFTIQRQNFSMY